MQGIMERVISLNQNGFVKGKAISDSILLASQLMTTIHKAKKVKNRWLDKVEKEKKLQGIRFDRRGSTISHMILDPDNCNTVRTVLEQYSELAG
ncbi:reverse transcriptase [Senna tora]|uniref:Reverse transcriptase n=1 Tax=Senna tora TaxID=362788 RepID=A0A834T306_9FABA|nr:reverse transcriptase [Senna tora]